MLYLFFAMLASTSILICFKVFDKLRVGIMPAIAVNYLTGAIMGYFLTIKDVTKQGIIESSWLILAVFLGFILIAGFILFAISTRQAGIAITSISSRVSVVFSVLLGIFLFHDDLSLVKISGFFLAIISLILIFYRKNKVESNWTVILIPLLVFLLSGLNDSTLKIVQHYYIQDNDIAYVSFAATSFFSAFLLSIPLLIYEYCYRHLSISFRSIVAGIILGILNWLSIYFMLKGLNIMSVSVFFPILNIGVVTLSTIIGYIIFKEKLRMVNMIGISLAVISIILITTKY